MNRPAFWVRDSGIGKVVVDAAIVIHKALAFRNIFFLANLAASCPRLLLSGEREDWLFKGKL